MNLRLVAGLTTKIQHQGHNVLSSKPMKPRSLGSGRPGFMEWVDQHSNPGWAGMPLTHITKGVVAEDIMRCGRIEPVDCPIFCERLAYFFYGRPAYRVSEEGVVKAEALCPFCFIFDPKLIDRAKLFMLLTQAHLALDYTLQ